MSAQGKRHLRETIKEAVDLLAMMEQTQLRCPFCEAELKLGFERRGHHQDCELYTVLRKHGRIK